MASGFDLDLQTVEQEIRDDVADGDGTEGDCGVVLGVLDGTTDEREWAEVVDRGDVLVLSVEGELSELAADLTDLVTKRGGNLVHFRDFLIVTPAGVTVDSSRLR